MTQLGPRACGVPALGFRVGGTVRRPLLATGTRSRGRGGLGEGRCPSWGSQAVDARSGVDSPVASSAAHAQAPESPVIVSTTGRFGGRGATTGCGRWLPLGLAPQSRPSPTCAIYLLAALGEHLEPPLPARCSHSGPRSIADLGWQQKRVRPFLGMVSRWGSGASRALKARRRMRLMGASIMVSALGPRLFAARRLREAGLVRKRIGVCRFYVPARSR